MRVGIVGIQNLKHMTTVSVYTDILNKHGIEYDIIYMDKYGIEEKNNARKAYRYEMKNKTPGIVGKAVEALRFYRYATQIMKKEKYDFIILWREYAVFLFSSFVYRNYKGRYSVNIRDLWNEKNFLVTLGVKRAIKGSAFNTVCSDGFIPYLPKADYIFLHCINYEASESLKQKLMAHPANEENKDKTPINIVYLGTLRFEEYCRRMTDIFANDSRFCVKFIGQGSDKIKKYAQERCYTNVECVGAFAPEQTADFLLGSDIINCAYGAESKAEKALLPTRFYYAIDMGVPVLTSEGTWMQKKADDLHMGISIPSNLEDGTDIANRVFSEYTAMSKRDINTYTAAYRNEIFETKKQFEDKFLRLLVD